MTSKKSDEERRFCCDAPVSYQELSEPIVSDGGKTSYYELPVHATELKHLISHKSMSKARGDIFKACYRLGEKAGTSVDYDINKILLMAQDLKEMNDRGEHI